MKKIKYFIITILIIIILLIRFSMIDIFKYIKEKVKDDFSLYNLSFIYANTFQDDISKVSSTETISVKDYYSQDEKIYVTTLNNKVSIPYKGIITKRNNNFIRIEVSYDISFYIANINPEVVMYQSVGQNEVLGRSESYVIWSDNAINLNLLNYEIVEDEA